MYVDGNQPDNIPGYDIAKISEKSPEIEKILNIQYLCMLDKINLKTRLHE